nr:ATP synthase F0 subunit 8 [Amblyomma nodosum]
MPQLYPMNWIILTLIVFFLFLYMMINIYFFNFKKKCTYKMKTLFHSWFNFKW